MRSDIFVIMGVCGCGKSTVGTKLARSLGLKFVEGDTLHSAASVAKMSAGIPLSDLDRAGWLQLLSEHIVSARQADTGLVLSCSALKRSYRDVLRRGATDICLIHLHGERHLLEVRMAARTGHYMPLSLLESQLDILEAPSADENALQLDIALAPEAIVAAICCAVGA